MKQGSASPTITRDGYGEVHIIWPDPDNKPVSVLIATDLLEEMISQFNRYCVRPLS